MDGRGWRLSFLVLALVIMVALGLNWLEQPVPLANDEVLEPNADEPREIDLRVYFPAWQGMNYTFAGEGMEFAAFSRQITHTAPGYLQMEDLSGTNLVQVVEYSATELKIIWVEEEFYSGESILDAEYRAARDSGSATDLTLLKAPIVQGNTWTDERFRREIVAIDEVVSVPLGVFYDVIVVKNQSLDADDFIQYEYYAKNMGLIKREAHLGEEDSYTVVSSLESVVSSR